MTEKLMTYALGRGSRALRYAGRPRNCARRGEAGLQVFGVGLQHRESTPFQMKKSPVGRKHVRHKEAPFAKDVSAGRRGHDGVAVARFHGSGIDGCKRRPQPPRVAAWGSSICRTARSWIAGRRRPKGQALNSRRSSSRSRSIRDRLNVVSGLRHQAADSSAVHSLSPTTWLSGVRPKATQGTDALPASPPTSSPRSRSARTRCCPLSNSARKITPA